MPDFLLELRSEEIPARMQAGARAELEKLFRREMDAALVATGEITVWSTPRRLALIARDLPERTGSSEGEIKGPPVGAPDQAIDGFCRKYNITRDVLGSREIKGRETYTYIERTLGRDMRDALSEVIQIIIRDFSWPKSMRWGDASLSTESMRWVRPLSGIVALLGEDLVGCEVHGVTSGWVTKGHRFHTAASARPELGGGSDITIGSADDYAEKLRACHVIVDHEERQDIIRSRAAAAAQEAGLTLVEDEGLVVENAGLTEWPVPLLGRFDEEFLDVPPEVIQLTARVNQKYFVCESPEGDLANAFVCTANIEAQDGGAAIVDGNRKVLAARLSDARFFWEMDRKTTLEDHAKKLERITFHEKLGTVADKVERVAKLARWLVEEGIVTDAPLPLAGGAGGGPVPADQASPTPNPSRKREGNLANLAEQAARLCKADLVTEMVGEFPELQGLMGGYYARAEGLPDEVAEAIRDHYKPVGQGDEVPTAPVTVAVSLADKLDTLSMFFAVDEKPTGSKDPFALRRACLGIISIIVRNDIRMSLSTPIAYQLTRRRNPQFDFVLEDFKMTLRALTDRIVGLGELSGVDMGSREELKARRKSRDERWKSFDEDRSIERTREIFDFFADRLKVQQREAGVRHDLIDAVFALGGEDDLVRLLARVKALQSFVETEDGENLLAGYKRAANILKKEDWATDPSSVRVERSRDTSSTGVSTSLDANGNANGKGDDLEPHTGEEDPFAALDDPELGSIIRAGMEHHELSYTPEPAEKALIDALDSAEPKATAAIAEEDFTSAMSALASLRAPIDAFFEEVVVNDEDKVRRAHRLDLLARFRAAVHNVADFSRVEG